MILSATKGQKMNEYVCEHCGSVFKAESEAEARETIEECTEYMSGWAD